MSKASYGTCHNCGKEIKVSIFRSEIWCSDDCRKALNKDASSR